MNNKDLYNSFCKEIYTPIFSKPWWLDAICGKDGWDVWLYEKGGTVVAAMPYYSEDRNGYKYITKAPLTQNNGLLIKYPEHQSSVKKAKLEEEIVNEAIRYIDSLAVDVYEQQYHYSFQNYLPFYWEGFDVIPRVTYVIENTSIEDLSSLYTANYRNTIRKGKKSVSEFSTVDPNKFYHEHEKIYERQGLQCPFSYELWMRLYDACQVRDSGEIMVAMNADGAILSVSYIIRDEKSSYLLMGGAIPEYASLQTYSTLVDEGIKRSIRRGLSFDFEGSVIKRINHSFREYGGSPKMYYRIRKVFNPDIILQEAKNKIKKLIGE